MFTLRSAAVRVALLSVMAASSFIFAAGEAEGRVCTVAGVVGNVQVRYAPGYDREKAAAAGLAAPVSGSISGEWSDLRQNMTVGAGCEVQTGPGSEARLEMSGGAVLKVEENALVEIAFLQAAARQPAAAGAAPETEVRARFRLLYGNLVGNVKKVIRGERLNVLFETPTATAAIRGTVIEIEAARGANTLIRAFDGTIAVAAAADAGKRFVEVGDGKMVEIAPDQAEFEVADVPSGYKRKSFLLKGENAPEPIEGGMADAEPDGALASGPAPDKGDAPGAADVAAAGKDGPAAAAPSAAPEKDKADGGGSTPIFAKPGFELGLGMATVDGRPWTRIALGADIPIWKFGVFLDLELFIDDESKLSKKGWDWKDNKAEFIYRKIRYIRYGHEDEPLFVKLGGLSDVTLGYGMIVDRFTNMLRYPDEKLLGLQFYLNDISPIGLTVQTLISDFAEMKDDGGVFAARAAVRPLKTSGIPLLDGLSVGAMYAVDANVQAPARKWTVGGDDAILRDMRDKYDTTAFFNDYKEIYRKYKNQDPDAVLARLDVEDSLRRGERSFALYGFDAGLPVIKTKLLSVDLYGQSAFRADSVSGWGIGAPGVAVRIWKLAGNVEYRKVEGRFTPGYFDTYYLDERYSRGLVKSKDEYIDSVSLNGVFGRLGMDVFGVLKVDGAYQYMIGEDSLGGSAKSQLYEATAGIGEAVVSRIPKINLAEVYIRNANVGIYDKYDKGGNPVAGKKAGLFDRSPGMYWGYRAGFEIASGASLIWDYRYSWKIEGGKLVPDNKMLLQTALRF